MRHRITHGNADLARHPTFTCFASSMSIHTNKKARSLFYIFATALAFPLCVNHNYDHDSQLRKIFVLLLYRFPIGPVEF